MFKKLFAVVVVSVLVLQIAEAKLKKVGKTAEPKSETAAPSTPQIAVGPVVTDKGVVFSYTNPSAKSVFIAGSFNDWNSSRDALVKDSKGIWKITLPLKVGLHQYKFVVDGNWLEDPLNPNKTDDGLGGKNSVVEVKLAPTSITGKGPQVTKDGIKFIYKNPAARSVFLAGEFNNWSERADPMVKQKDGSWVLVKALSPGKYQYKFIADGVWITDPENPNTVDDGYGGKNSVVEVSKKDAPAKTPTLSGPRQLKNGVEFTYFNPSASRITIAGSFNNWNTNSHILSKDRSGIWRVVIPLGRGVYQYKFIVDGSWTQDPSNPKSADDGYGGKNSVVEVK